MADNEKPLDLGTVPKTEKLDNNNYRRWSIILRDFLRSKSLWDVVNADPNSVISKHVTIAALTSSSDGTAQPAASSSQSSSKEVKGSPADFIKDYAIKNDFALAMIRTNCSIGQLDYILDCDYSYTAWKTLERIHKRRGESYFLSLLRNFHGYQSNGESVDDVAANLSRIQLEIGNCEPGDKPSERTKTLRLLECFKNQDSTKSRVDALFNTGTLPDFLTTVNQLKEAQSMNAEPEPVKMVKGKGKNGSKGPSQWKCKHCDKTGHRSESCWKWLATDEGRAYVEKKAKDTANRGGDVKSRKPEKANKVIDYESDHSDRSVAWLSTANGKRDDKWYLDTCAAYHMTWNRQLFTSPPDTTEQVEVEVAEGTVVRSAGRGTIKVPMGDKDLQLSGVHYIPQLTANLISVGELESRGYTFMAQPGGKAVIVKSGVTTGVGKRVGKVYVLERVYKIGLGSALAVRARPIENPKETELSSEEYSRLYHRRLGHIGRDRTAMMHKYVNGLREPLKPLPKSALCDPCAKGKLLRIINKTAPTKASERLGRVYSDWWGPYRIQTLGGEVYILTFADEATGKSWVYLAKIRDELYTLFREWRAYVELQSGCKLKVLRCDNAKEYEHLAKDLTQEGVAVEFVVPYTPEQNGVAERLNRTLITTARVMILDTGLPQQLWGDAVKAANHVKNRLPMKGKDKTPEELWTGQKPSVAHLRVWGCLCYVSIPREKRDGKLDAVGKPLVFVGYEERLRQYRCFDPTTGEYARSAHVDFYEKETWGSPFDTSKFPPDQGELAEGAEDSDSEESINTLPLTTTLPMINPHRNNCRDNNSPATVTPRPSEEDEPSSPIEPRNPSPIRQVTDQNNADNAVEYDSDTIVVDTGAEYDSDDREVETGSNTAGAVHTRTRPANQSGGVSTSSQQAVTRETTPQHVQARESRSGRTIRAPVKWQPLTINEEKTARAAEKAAREAEPAGQGPSQREPARLVAGRSTDPPDNKPKVQHPPIPEVTIPKTFEEAVSNKRYGREWRLAIEAELTALLANRTWEYVDIPKGTNIVDNKWVFDVKYTPNGQIDRFKARLVARGFSQAYGEDYDETFSPTVRKESLRLLFAIVAKKGWLLHQMDANNAFLVPALKEIIYMHIPQGVQDQEGKVCKVLKSLYGLKQSARYWFIEIRNVFIQLGFKPTKDPCLFIHKESGSMIGLHVDDLLIAAPNMAVMTSIKAKLLEKFKMKDMGDATLFLGMRIRWDRANRVLRIDQSRYTRSLLGKFGMEDSNPVATPIDNYNHLRRAMPGDERCDQLKYQQAVGGLVYLSNLTRPDITYSVNRLSQCIQDPSVSNWNGVLRVFRYLKGTIDKGITFKKTDSDLEAVY